MCVRDANIKKLVSEWADERNRQRRRRTGRVAQSKGGGFKRAHTRLTVHGRVSDGCE